jgi:long-subunit fatty acid transport protein
MDVMITQFQFSNPVNPGATDTRATPLPQISLVKRSDDGQWAYGLGVFTPAGFSAIYQLQSVFPYWGPRQYKSFGSLAKVLPGLAYRLDDQLSVGATLGVAVSYDQLNGPYFLQSPPLRGLPTLLDLRATGAALCWSAGLQYKLTEATTLGATYQSESRFEAHGPAEVTAPLLGSSTYDSRLDITWPRSVGVGVRHALCPCRIVSADVLWTNWSEAFDTLDIHLRNPGNPWFPPYYEQLPLRWRDTVSLRAGYERVLDGGKTLRFGYVYHRNPIPAGTLTPYIQAILEHAFSAGYGWTWQCWNVDVAYMFSFGPDQRVGVSDLAGGDFSQSINRAQTHCIAVGATRRW